ncbi:MAG TPA: hypothetical protein VHJ78_13030 [Actinomycetota bacterium]|nr:hypothetical protein [Actinomycetota bacterium]
MGIDDWGSGFNERVVLARRDPNSWVGFQWTGEEPEGLSDPNQAISYGAEWDGDELVTYNNPALHHRFSRERDGWMEDSD